MNGKNEIASSIVLSKSAANVFIRMCINHEIKYVNYP